MFCEIACFGYNSAAVLILMHMKVIFHLVILP